MSQIFSPSMNTWFRMALLLAPIGLGLGAYLAHAWTWSHYATGKNRMAVQPVPFSHAHHVGELGIDCRYCHTTVESSGFANVPPTRTCMNCHQQMWTGA